MKQFNSVSLECLPAFFFFEEKEVLSYMEQMAKLVARGCRESQKYKGITGSSVTVTHDDPNAASD